MRVGLRLFIVSLLLLVTLAMRVNSLISSENNTITLEDAVKQKLISADIKGNGGYSGNCLKLAIKNLGNKSISISIPAGTMFKPSDDGAQNILVPKDQIFVLAGSENKNSLVRGFCCEATDHAPSKDMSFAISKNTNPKMVQLINFVKTKSYADNILQDAIWCVSNNHEITDIYAPNMEVIKPLRDELCKITGQKDEWYSTPKEHKVDEDGNISHETIQVSGQIKFKALANGKVHNEIYDSENKVLVKNPNSFEVIPGNIEYGFDIKVKGWKKGTYYVKVFENEKVIHSQEFKI